MFTAVFSRDGKRIATGAFDDGTVVIWNVDDGSVHRRIKVGSDHSVVHGIDFSPDGKRIVTANWSRERNARIWDIDSGIQVREFRGHSQGITDARFSRDGRHLLTGSSDHTARIWDVQTGAELRSFVGHTHNIWRVAWFPDETRVATAGWDGTAKIWDVESVANPFLLPFEGASSVECFPNSNLAVLGGSVDLDTNDQAQPPETMGIVRLVNFESGTELRQFHGHDGPVLDVDVFPDGRRFVSCGSDGTVRIWDLDSNQPTILSEHKAAVNSVDVSQDGQWIVSGSNDRTAIVWRVATGEPYRVFDDLGRQSLCVGYHRGRTKSLSRRGSGRSSRLVRPSLATSNGEATLHGRPDPCGDDSRVAGRRSLPAS